MSIAFISTSRLGELPEDEDIVCGRRLAKPKSTLTKRIVFLPLLYNVSDLISHVNLTTKNKDTIWRPKTRTQMDNE